MSGHDRHGPDFLPNIWRPKSPCELETTHTDKAAAMGLRPGLASRTATHTRTCTMSLDSVPICDPA